MEKILFLLFAWFSCISGICQVPVWEELNSNATHFLNIIQLKDGSIVAAGGTGNNFTGEYPARVAKYSSIGVPQWQHYGRVQITGECDIKQAQNGNLIYAGSLHRFDTLLAPNPSDTYLQQINVATGDTLTTWAQTYVTPTEFDFSTELLILPNGDIVSAGMSIDQIAGAPSHKYYTLRRTDSLGNELWSKRYAKNGGTYGTRLLLNSAGNFVLAGRNYMPNNVTPYHPYLMEISPDGDSLRGKTVIIKDSSISGELGRLF